MVAEHVADAQHQGLPLEPEQLQYPPLEEEGQTPGPVQEVAATIERVQMLKKIPAKEKPWRVIPEIVEWSRTFDGPHPLGRCKFLVLDGPSQMGKRSFVQSTLVSRPEEALVLDCADAVIPQFKGTFDNTVHKLVLFDEAHAEMIVRCKKLFQSSVNPMIYGSSCTNAFVHSVWIYGVKLVVVSKVWQAELKALPKEQADWIEANSIYVRVDRPLFL